MAGRQELRLGLVLNGGVSLAVWIGGVTREIDAARRASMSDVMKGDTGELYQEILDALDVELVVDVIAGASAGGINGVLLGSAIYNGTGLAELDKTWLSLGDFRRLLRSPSLPDPPSLMKGDQVVLPALRKIVQQLWVADAPRPSRPLYLYVTATDLPGFGVNFIDSYGDAFKERDHRRVFGFEHEPHPVDASDYSQSVNNKMRLRIGFGDPDAQELLALAARASSSFPVAFEAHSLEIVGEKNEHPMVDGGILDNQPFNPVLDRVAVLPATNKPVRRSVVYVVPYATAAGPDDDPVSGPVSARDTFSAASSLPRDLPKLQSLERVTRERTREETAEYERQFVFSRIEPGDLHTAATALFNGYKAARFTATQSVFELWQRPEFRPGGGAIAQHPADDPRDLLRPPEVKIEPSPVPWIPLYGLPSWSPTDETWLWGLSPAERAATWALLYLRDAAKTPEGLVSRTRLLNERIAASRLIAFARDTKIVFRRTFLELLAAQIAADTPTNIIARARSAYENDAVTNRVGQIQQQFADLDSQLREATGRSVESLLHIEVARGACLANPATPAPFDFLFASARVENSLGHSASTPDEKLAGLKLGHFGGFLKRSWRANDWLWGRMDGIEHLMRVTIDADTVAGLDGAQRTQLAEIAFPEASNARPGEIEALGRCWQATRNTLGLNAVSTNSPRDELVGLLADKTSPRNARIACQRALAARLQLRVLGKDLRRIAETAQDDLASGSSRIADGAFWSNRFPLEKAVLSDDRLVSLFHDMNVGSESILDESSSRLVMDVGAQTAATAVAVFAGNRGGLPTAAKAALGTARGATLVISRLVRLLAREPWVGAAVVAIFVGLLVYAAVIKNTLLGAFLPALALLVAAGAISLLTIATSVFELSVTTISRVAAAIVFVGLPIGFALTTHWPTTLSTSAARWCNSHFGHLGTTIAVTAAAVAGIAALARLLIGIILDARRRSSGNEPSGSWIRTVLFVYRGGIVAAAGALVIGFLVERTLNRHGGAGRWVAVADERRGTLVVVLLISVLAGAALIEEGMAAMRSATRKLLRR